MSEVSLKGSLPQALQDVAANNQGHKVFKVREAMLKKYGDKWIHINYSYNACRVEIIH